MSKAFKYTNNNYIDSSSIVHNRELLSDILNNLIESGSSSNGSYIKYSDGTMICYGSYNFTSDNGDFWTNFYRSGVYTVYFPQEYVSKPNLNVITSADYGSISVVYSSITNKSFSLMQIKSKGIVPDRDKMNSGQWFAIGKWK